LEVSGVSLGISEFALLRLVLGTLEAVLGGEAGGLEEEVVKLPLGIEDLVIGNGGSVRKFLGVDSEEGLGDDFGLDAGHGAVAGDDYISFDAGTSEDFSHDVLQTVALDVFKATPLDIEFGKLCQILTS